MCDVLTGDVSRSLSITPALTSIPTVDVLFTLAAYAGGDLIIYSKPPTAIFACVMILATAADAVGDARCKLVVHGHFSLAPSAIDRSVRKILHIGLAILGQCDHATVKLVDVEGLTSRRIHDLRLTMNPQLNLEPHMAIFDFETAIRFASCCDHFFSLLLVAKPNAVGVGPVTNQLTALFEPVRCLTVFSETCWLSARFGVLVGTKSLYAGIIFLAADFEIFILVLATQWR
ncbi:hypothetical protein CLU91_5554 [Janthinobacterium sp. 64]|nr:hypothetical protein CLU91_5554 [Janthinobacterium sp. 64]